MNPNDQQQSQPPIVNQATVGDTIQPQPAVEDPTVAKKVNNAGRSMLSLGIFLAVIFSLVLVFSNKSLKGVEIVLTGAYIDLSIILAIIGVKTRKTNITQAKQYLLYGVFVCAGIVVVAVLKSIVAHSNLGLAGLLALFTLIYLLVVKVKVSKLS